MRGEKRAWDEFVDRYSKFVYWSIWKALETSGVSDKEEVCRETFQELFRRILERPRLEKLATASSPRKYLQVTATNLVLERFRRAGSSVRFEVSAEEEAGQASDPGGSPQEQAVLNERRAVLDKVLGRLKPKERTCLELHYLDGKTHQEISGLLGLPLHTVSSIVRRTLEKLRERLRKKGMGGGE